MTRLVAAIRSPIARFVASCLVVFAAAAATTSTSILILLLNDLLMSAAFGVCWAYAPLLPGALAGPSPAKGEYLGTGIFLQASSVLLLRIASLIGRDLGWPEIYNTPMIPFALLLGLMGALLHLWAPNAVEGRIPRQRWVFSGALVAVGSFIALAGWTIRMAVIVGPVTVQLR